jgi:hypothetical protein
VCSCWGLAVVAPRLLLSVSAGALSVQTFNWSTDIEELRGQIHRLNPDRTIVPVGRRLLLLTERRPFLGAQWLPSWHRGWAYTSVDIPLWCVLLAFCVPDGIARIRRAARMRTGRCANCGYDLRGSPQRCPECGQPAQRPLRKGSEAGGVMLEKVQWNCAELAEAFLIWTGWGKANMPKRDDSSVEARFGQHRASELLAVILAMMDEFYAADAMSADLVEMGAQAAAQFRAKHPEVPDDVLKAMAWCYTFDLR